MHTHTRTHAHTHARTHACTHEHAMTDLSLVLQQDNALSGCVQGYRLVLRAVHGRIHRPRVSAIGVVEKA
jgi:hypothetical protein